ncbi:ubiquitin-conjugating enzyme E2-17 kDa-like [Ruditapes philippinarum]|uniref:ubiquitin-conjugating enzyme E2-17 kDa-like n=1 Tax=Ruditapes philippinarum TaxID=129788 RepID=UPI00295A7562|nr:ubiquitin-conjugating enzyme E2-17 kDa-like [Ruditapes philippinarum]
MALKFLSKQLQRVFEELPQQPGFSAGPLEDDLLHWTASIVGPADTPYEGGQFDLRMDFPTDYPLKPPKIWFLTKVYHPNVDAKGKICIDFLLDEWKPSFSISYILLAICSLLMHPNAENPIVQEIADLYLKDRDKFNENAREMTLKHAKPDI